jgi:hypothetical protein
MMHPNVGVVGIERNAVIQTTHDAQITELHTLGLAHQEAEALDGGIVANALEGEVQLAVGFASLHLNAFLLAAQGIKVIDEEQYREVLKGVTETKWATYTDDDEEKNMNRLTAFLLSRGYEIEIIKEITKDFIE